MKLFHLKKHNFSTSALTKILISYIIVLLLPLSASSIIFTQLNRILMSNLDSYNQSVLGQVSLVVDNVVNTATRLSNLIAHDPDLAHLLSSAALSDDYQLYRFVSRLRDVYSLGSNIDLFDSFSVYFYNSDTVLSSGSKGNSRQYFSYIYGYENDEHYRQWYEHILKSEKDMAFIGNVPQEEESDFKPGIYFIQALPYHFTSKKTATIFFKINDQKIQESIDNIYAANSSQLFILDNKSNIILHNSDDIDILNTTDSCSSDHTTLIKYQGKKYYFKKFISEQTDWSIYCYTPQDVYISTTGKIQFSVIIVLLFCLAGGLLISYLLAKKNYSPIKELINIVTTNQSNDINNEFKFLMERVQSINAERNSLEKEVERQAPIIKNSLLLQLLKGQVNDNDWNNITTLAQINTENTAYIVMLLDIDNCQNFIESDNEYEWFLARYAVSNIAQEILESNFNSSVADMERNRLGIILDFNKNNINAKELAIDSANKIIHTLKESMMIDTTISISDVEFDLKNLFNAYVSALSTMKDKLIRGTGIVMTHSTESEQYYYYTMDEEEHLIHKARTGDIAEIDRQLEHIYDVNFVKKTLSPDVARCLLWDMFNTVIKTANCIGLKLDELSTQQHDLLNVFNDLSTFKQKISLIRSLYAAICTITAKNSMPDNAGLVQKIEQYIDTHYTDCMFSIAQMANDLQFTRQYLADIYKKQTNRTILTYLTMVRIEHAKKLLNDKNLTIIAVANAVGYIDDAGFRKAFKKMTGITPGKYRTLYL